MTSLARAPSYGAVLLLAAVALLACGMYAGLHHPIQDNNEGLYARIALEMLTGHSWVIPTIDGVPYMEKPPLLYWITAASFGVFGTGEGAARLGPMAGCVLLLGALYVFARRWWGERTAMLAAFIAASSPLVIVMERMLMFDMLFTGLYTWAVLAMYECVGRGTGRRWVRVAYAALALAVMTKGLVALAFYAALSLAAVLEPGADRKARLRRALDPVGISIFAALAVPWHVAAALAEPTFLWFYFVNEHVLRFLGLRVPHDYYRGSYWYYVPRLLAASAPWVLLLVTPRPRETEVQRPLRRFLWIALLVPFTFFSVAGAKANYYIIVALPPLVLLLARRLDRMAASRWTLVVPAGWAMLFTALCIAGPRVAGGAEVPSIAAMLCVCAFALCGLSAYAFLRRRVIEGAAASAAVAIPLALLFSAYLDANRNDNSTRDIAAEIERRGLKQVYVFRDYEALSSLGYYLQRPIGIVESASNDLWYGQRLRPDAQRFPSLHRFVSDGRYRDAAVVVAGRRARELQMSELGSRLEPVARFGRTTLYLWRRGPSRDQRTNGGASSRKPIENQRASEAPFTRLP